jgi:hypothetical protein
VDGGDTAVALGTASAEISSGTVVSGTTHEIRYKETAFGNLIADGIAAYAHYTSGETIDFALHNGQNVQAAESISVGDIMLTNLPGMTDTLYLVTYTGEQVKTIINFLVSSNTPSTYKANGIVLVSHGVQYTITPSGTPNTPPTVTDVKVNGSPINATKEYRVALGNFMATNANFPVGKNVVDTYKGTKLQDAVAYYILAKGTIGSVVEGRITGSVPPIYSIAGTIKNATGNVIEEAVVAITSGTTTVGSATTAKGTEARPADGKYTTTGVINGTYTVKVSKDGYTTKTEEVTVSSANITGKDFTLTVQ